jgi:hypothetical protein
VLGPTQINATSLIVNNATCPLYLLGMMVLDSFGTITVQLIASRDALGWLCQSFARLPNNPASLYLSATSQNLTIYVLPTQTVNVISLPYVVQALRRKDESAFALKRLLESGAAIKVFFDARKSAKILFDSCGIRLSTLVSFISARQGR